MRVPRRATNVGALNPDKLLIRKAQTILGHHRADAKKYGLTLDYDRHDLLVLLKAAQQCCYCKMPIGWDCEMDHATPLAWGKQACSLENLRCVCKACNRMKGKMNSFEFLALLAFLKTIDPRSAEDIRRRLQGGGKVYAKGRRRKKR